MAAPPCDRCGRGCRTGRSFRFVAGNGQPLRLCLWFALLHPPVLRRALLTSLVVGTALTAINREDALVLAPLTPMLLWKIPLTYAVPFGVSTYSALAISHDQTASHQNDAGRSAD